MAVGFEQDGSSGTIKYNGTDYLAPTEKIANKGAINGYPQLNGSQKVVEEPASKGNANGIASLDGNSRLVQAATNVQTAAPASTSGAVGVDSGKLKFGDGAQVRTVEQTSNKDQPNGYAGTDGANFINRQRIPSFVGILAQDFDPPSTLYVKNNFVTTLKTYTAGDGSHIMVTGYQLPAQGNASLRPRIMFKFDDNSTVFIENNSGSPASDNFQGIANILHSDAGAGSSAVNNGKRVVAVAFEVQNVDANNDITQDLGFFRVRAYVVPAGGGSVTITP